MRELARAVVTLFAVIGIVATIQELRGQTKAPLADATFRRIGIVVKDVDQAVKTFSDVFGVPAPEIITSTSVYPPQFAGNRNAPLKIALLKIGNLDVAVTQPLAGPQPHYDHLQKYGNSVQRLTFAVPDVDQARKALEARGGKWVLGREGYRTAYVDMRDQLGFVLEVQSPR